MHALIRVRMLRTVPSEFFFGPTLDLEFSQTLVSKVKFDVFNPLLTDFTQSVCVNFE